jgi:POT family proton-dependent oligopeptide transporter
MNNIVIILGVVITLATGIPVMMQLLRQHPKGLFVLFFAEMWERFSYYGMRGLLVFYLVQHFLFDDKFAGTQYGSYTSLVYLLPLVGGVLADRYLGTRKAILFGAVLLTIGQLAMAWTAAPAKETLTWRGHAYDLSITGRMADRQVRLMVDGKPYEFSGSAGGLQIKGLPPTAPLPAQLPKGSYKLDIQRNSTGVNLFYFALSMIIMGVGFLKPNISTIVGQLYPQGDPRRDAGFTLYYYGVNLGAFWAGVLCGYLGQTVGWWAGFGLAGVGMALGWVVFMAGKSWLEGHGEPPDPEKLKAPFLILSREWIIYILGVAGAAAVFYLVQHNNWVGVGLSIAILASLLAIVLIIVFLCKTWAQRQRMMLATVLIFGAVVFFTLFEQAGTSLNLFAARNVDLTITHQPHVWALGAFNVIFASPDQLPLLHGLKGLWIDTGFSAAQTQSFNPGFILIFAPVFAALWTFLGKRNLDPNPVLNSASACCRWGSASWWWCGGPAMRTAPIASR